VRQPDRLRFWPLHKSNAAVVRNIRRVTEPLSDSHLSFDFLKRPTGYAKELKEFLDCVPSLPFRDIARYGYSRTPQLIRQAENLAARETITDPIDLGDQIHGLLPDDQFGEMSGRHQPSLFSTDN
jgi:hypothetical protein